MPRETASPIRSPSLAKIRGTLAEQPNMEGIAQCVDSTSHSKRSLCCHLCEQTHVDIGEGTDMIRALTSPPIF